MISRTLSAALEGLEAAAVEVEADISGGLPAVTVVGLPDTAVKESRERVRSAIVNSGYRFPPRRVTVNLAPADLRKEGAAYDLAVAVALLLAGGTVEGNRADDFLLLGELALDGSVRSVRGALPAAMLARSRGLKGLLVPADSAPQAAVVGGVEVFGVRSLSDAVGFLSGKRDIAPSRVDVAALMGQAARADGADLSDVRGQASAKRALVIAAAGGHNLLMLCRESQAAGGGLRLEDGAHYPRIVKVGLRSQCRHGRARTALEQPTALFRPVDAHVGKHLVEALPNLELHSIHNVFRCCGAGGLLPQAA